MDLRYPMGLMFTIIGLLLIGYGVAYPTVRAPLTPLNVNLHAGFCMAGFGAFMLFLAARASK